jgi:outer membrane usher protein
LVTGLQPFQANSLTLRAEDLPFNVEIGGLERIAVPFARAGVVIDFPVRRSRNALVVLRRLDGSPVPVGAVVVLNEGRSFPVGRDGEVYLGNLADSNLLAARWADGHCGARFTAPPPAQLEARIGPLTCETLP